MEIARIIEAELLDYDRPLIVGVIPRIQFHV